MRSSSPWGDQGRTKFLIDPLLDILDVSLSFVEFKSISALTLYITLGRDEP